MSKINLNRNMYRQAALDRLTFSQYLEKIAPAPEGSGLDAFEVQLKERGIVTKTDYAKGISASIMENAFYRTEDNDVLFPEFVSRTVREAMVKDTVLPYLIGQYTTINSNSYKTIYCDDDPDNQSLKRVTEAASLPRAVLTTRNQEVKIYKYGRAIEASYEVIRRMQIDLLALHIGRFGVQAAKDKVQDVLTIAVAGDGNSNAAEILTLTSLDATATPGTLTAKAWIKFLMNFEEFACDTIVADKDAFLQILLTDLGTYTAADVIRLLGQGATSGVRLTAPQLPANGVNMFWNDSMTANYILGLNKNYAIEQVTEAGSEISEADKFITNQTQVLTISENSGFSKIFKEATKVLNLGA